MCVNTHLLFKVSGHSLTAILFFVSLRGRHFVAKTPADRGLSCPPAGTVGGLTPPFFILSLQSIGLVNLLGDCLNA